MKKLLCVLFLLLVLVSSVPAYAESLLESLDIFGSMSVSDLLKGRNVIENELAGRGYSELILPEGVYVVGKDIDAGKYALNIADRRNSLGMAAAVIVRTDSGDLIHAKSLICDSSTHGLFDLGHEAFMLELSPGQTVEVSGIPLVFFTCNGI